MSGGKGTCCDNKITALCTISSLRCQLSADFNLLDKPVICAPAATYASSQFVLDVDCNGVKVRIMYDTGASISFARPGLVVGTVEELMPLQATKVTLGDASVTQTRGARGHTFDVYGKAHDWIYQEMQLPKGIDFIIGMDFMTHHDVLLLPRRKQVLFGADLASAIDGDMGTVDTSHSSAADNVGRAGLHVAIDLSAQRGASVGNAVETIESTQMLGEADELSESGLEMRSVTASDCCIPPKTESLHGSKDWEPILCIDARVGNRMLQGNIDT